MKDGADSFGIKPAPEGTGPGRCAVAKLTILKKEAARKNISPVKPFPEPPYASGSPVKPLM
jgi:hypothetical protein